MKVNKLTLKDKKTFNARLEKSGCRLAAFSFSNIYIWRCFYSIEWALVENSLCVFLRDSLGCFMYLPPLPFNPAAVKAAFAHMDGINKHREISRIENIPSEQQPDYQNLGYAVAPKDPDYLCLRSDLALLKGNRFKSHRAACNFFIKHNVFEASALRRADKKACLELFDSWAAQRKAHCNETVYCGMLEDSRKVLLQALDNYREMGFRGVCVKIGSRIKAFSFGYPLNSDTFCVLYEITDLAVKGLAQFIFRSFCQELKGFKYINIMDDSGIENLRKTKLAYKPVRIEPAYIASRR